MVLIFPGIKISLLFLWGEIVYKGVHIYRDMAYRMNGQILWDCPFILDWFFPLIWAPFMSQAFQAI